jgi:hypothetical protein
MMVLVTLLLSLALPGSHPVTPLKAPVDRHLTQPARKGGRWYFAESGHAVYCYGPVRMIPMLDGGLQRVATYCQGTQPIVLLRD